MGIVKKIDRMANVKEVRGDFPVKYRYTMPPHLESFFLGLRERGAFTGARCAKCGTVYVPPVWFCERCFVRADGKVELPDTGTLQAFTIAREGPEGQRLESPLVFGIVKLRGASTVLFHRVLADPKVLKPGMKVKAQLKPPKRRRGSITDIEGFVPV